MKNFVNTGDHDIAELDRLITTAIDLKSGKLRDRPLEGKSVALVFFDPSLRTRASMQVGIYELGGNAVILEPGSTSWTIEHNEGVVMDGNKTEHVSEFVRVLERYVSAIGVRAFAPLENFGAERLEPMLSAFVRYASVPVINLESAMHHPCQSMADMMTIREKLGTGRKKVLLNWAWHPKPLPMAVPNSFALAAAQFGHDLTIAHPPGYELDDELIVQIAAFAGQNSSELRITHDIHAAFDDADIVYTKSWGSKLHYGDAAGDMERRSEFRPDWITDEAKMARTNDAIFMHCLPVRRNVIVTDGVIDSARSVVIDQAENRLHIQKAILTEIIK